VGPWRIEQAAPGERLIKGKIGTQPFLKAIQDAGIPKSQAYRVYTALKGEKDLDHCRPHHQFVALVEAGSGKLKAFEYIVDEEEIYQAKEGNDGLLVGKRLDLKVKKRRFQGSLVMLTESIDDALAAAQYHPSLRRVLDRALEGHTSSDQFKAGDRLRLVVQEVTVLGEFARYSGIEALEYLPYGAEAVRIYYVPTLKKYYDARGRAPGEGGFRKPVKGAPITSKFNPQRLHPILKKRMPHNGTDFGAPTGTAVHASSYGKVVKLGNYGANGNYIAIEHPNRFETGYSHLSRFEPGLKVGDQVKRMQVIGYVGSTGRSTGPHLHFSARKDGKYVDPESLQLDALSVLGSNERPEFLKVKALYDDIIETIPLPPPPEVASVTPRVPEASPLELELAPLDPANPLATAVTGSEIEVANGDQESELEVPGAATPEPAPHVAITADTPTIPSSISSPLRSLYITDRELMQSQAATDDGEVDE
jgi:murein DD-endopeptidase MepM/ murein hydrolase activator NlpD